jgi:hypothetical protein
MSSQWEVRLYLFHGRIIVALTDDAPWIHHRRWCRCEIAVNGAVRLPGVPSVPCPGPKTLSTLASSSHDRACAWEFFVNKRSETIRKCFKKVEPRWYLGFHPAFFNRITLNLSCRESNNLLPKIALNFSAISRATRKVGIILYSTCIRIVTEAKNICIVISCN